MHGAIIIEFGPPSSVRHRLSSESGARIAQAVKGSPCFSSRVKTPRVSPGNEKDTRKRRFYRISAGGRAQCAQGNK